MKYEDVLKACKHALTKLGEDWRKLSWFGQWKASRTGEDKL
jgi:hypothetical protein